MKIFTLLALLVCFHSEAAFREGTVEQMLVRLDRQTKLIVSLEKGIELSERGRLVILRQSSERLAQAIRDPKMGPIHSETTRRVHDYVIKYEFSKTFLASIKTLSSSSVVDAIWETGVWVKDLYGFSESPLFQITKSTFEQLDKLVRQFVALDPPASLKNSLENLVVDMGRLIAIASLGDNLKTFEAAKPVCKTMVDLYPALISFAKTDPAFSLLLEFQGLTDFYIDFAKVG